MFKGGTVEEIYKNCIISCQSFKNLLITEVQTDVYVITHPNPATKIKCGNTTQRFQNSSFITPGAVELKLPCDCEMIQNDEILIPKKFSCGTDSPTKLKMVHVLPAAWLKPKSLQLDPVDNEKEWIFRNMTEILNNDWELNIPNLNLTQPEKSHIYPSLSAHKFYVPYAHHTDTIFLVWVLILSLAVGYIIYRLRIIGAMLLIRPASGLNAEEHGSVWQNPFPYAMGTFILLLICILVIIIVYLWNKYYKKYMLGKNSKRSKNNINKDNVNVPLGRGLIILPNGQTFTIKTPRNSSSSI